MPAGLLTKISDRMSSAPVDPRLRWRERARPEQLLPDGEWRVCYWQGGRGSGKTASGAGALAEWVLGDQPDEDDDGAPREYGIIGPTYADAWTKCVEGEAGILRQLGTSMAQVKDHRSSTVRAAWRTYGQVVLHNGITIFVDSAAEGGLRIQGRNLRGAWADEIGLWLNWETAWKESLSYAVRKGRAQIVATGTPKASRPARKLIRGLIKNDPEYGGVVVRKLRTIDNAANLSKAFLRAVVGAAQGTRLERQELEGELLDDVANALWTRDLLERIVVPGVGEKGGPEFLRNVVIGVDPSDGKEDSDEQAYTIVGEGLVDEGKIYVAESWGGQEAPAPFARRVLIAAVMWNASIVVEKNHGGEWLTTVFDQVAKELIEKKIIKYKPKVRVVHASHAKRTRAEPVSALYERDLVRHCHRILYRPCDCDDNAHPDGHRRPDEDMPELEDQMATFTGAQGERSPDRLDSLVWALSTFLRKTFGVPGGKSGKRDWAAQREIENVGSTPEQRISRRIASAHGGAYAERDNWDLDDFAPQHDDSAPALEEPSGHDRPRRNNVRHWGGT